MSTATAATGSLEEHGNPLIGLAVAAIQAVLYLLDAIKNLVAWLTITLPR